MNILLAALSGEFMTLVPKLREEGHDVIAWIKDKHSKRVGEGIVFTTEDPESVAAQADLIIFTENSMGDVADRWRKKGYLVWNGGSAVDRLEYDRPYGMKVFSDFGISIPDTYEVSSTEEAKACLASEFAKKDKVVLKIDGDEAAGSSFSYVASSTQDVLDQLQHWEEDSLLPKKWSGILQRFVDGIEVSTEAWWNGEEWSTHNITIEEKKLFPGNLGPAIGCSYNTILRIDPGSKLFKLVLEPLGGFLKDIGYVGQIDTNAIVDEDGVPHALEFTPRPGYDATPTLAWGNNHGYGNKIGMVLGLGTDGEFGYKGRYFAGIRVHVPPYPFIDTKDEELQVKAYEEAMGVPVDVPSFEDFYPFDVCQSESGQLVCAGTTGIIGIAMGAGDDPAAAGKAAQKVAQRLRIPNKAFRIDGWKRAQEQIPELLAMKLIKPYKELP